VLYVYLLISQSPNVWPLATTSMCWWHLRRAVMKHLVGSNTIITAGKGVHAPIDYHNQERWGRDASFLQTGWGEQQNLLREQSFRRDVIERCPPDSTDDFIEERIQASLRNKKMVCCPLQSVQSEVIEMMDGHLRFHPLLALAPENQQTLGEADIWRYWREQVEEMHNLCRSRGESWTWE